MKFLFVAIVNLIFCFNAYTQIHWERANEYAFGLKWISITCPKKIADIGTGYTAMPAIFSKIGSKVTATDIDHNIKNKHYTLTYDDITNTSLPAGQFDMVTCFSTLEHIEDHNTAVANMVRLLKPGGYLILTFPFTYDKYIPDTYKHPDSNASGRKVPYICRSFSKTCIDTWCKSFNCKIIDMDLWKFWTGKFWRSGDYIYPGQLVTANRNHQLGCFALKKL